MEPSGRNFRCPTLETDPIFARAGAPHLGMATRRRSPALRQPASPRAAILAGVTSREGQRRSQHGGVACHASNGCKPVAG
jgi:hypothetical protein